LKGLLFIILFLSVIAPISAYEFAGLKTEYMNAEKTNFYGFGLFTSNKRFDAEIEFFLSTKVFKGESEAKALSDKAKLFFYSFAAYFHFIRTDSISYYIGTGIMPLLPKVYAVHATLGMDFFWGENWRVFYNFRYLYNNASTAVNYRYPGGATFAFGFKYTWDFIKI
ncbi:MAG: hypothetical protein D6767_07945, partial [Candidatus Hydrogenedentota bacterium]